MVALAAAAAVLAPVAASPAAAQSSGGGDGVVVIANGWSPPDVGAAAPLAGRLDAAVLYASKGELGQPTVDALEELDPSRVLLMGGPAALAPAVESQVRRTLGGATVERFSGADRIDTAAKAALSAPRAPAGRVVVIANGWSPPDVGAAAPLAASLGGSVLFAKKDSLGAPTVAALRRLAPSQIIVVGGTAALSTRIEAELGKVVPGVQTRRLAGTDRTDTAARGTARSGVGLGAPVVLADGWSPADVGIAAPLAATLGGSVLVTQRSTLGERTAVALSSLSPSRIILIGGSERLANAVNAELERRQPGVQRVNIAGADRITTAALAALLGVQASAQQERFKAAVATVAPGDADCDAAPPLNVRGIRVVDPPASLNDTAAALTVAEVARIAGGCVLVDYVELADRTVNQVRSLLADEPTVFAVGEPLRGFKPLHDTGTSRHTDYGLGTGSHHDDGVSEQWALHESHMKQLWDGWDDANAVAVAVIDSGVDATHRDLAGQVVPNHLSEGEPRPVLGGCHVTDSWDTDEAGKHQRPSGHGTHVAGIIAARRGNGGIAGVAPDAKVIPLNIWHNLTGTDDRRGCIDDKVEPGPGTYFSVPGAVAEAIMRGARVINMSFAANYAAAPGDDECGGPDRKWRPKNVNQSTRSAAQSLFGALNADCDAFRQLLEIGDSLPPDDDGARSVVAVAGAGNCGVECEEYEWNSTTEEWEATTIGPNAYALPAAFPSVISVAAIDDAGNRAPFSSARTDVLVAAPGVDILSALPTANPGNIDWAGWSGTSMASPFVAGVVAHMLNRHPNASPEQVRQALEETARDRGAAGRDDKYGHGIVQPLAAIERLGKILEGAEPRLASLRAWSSSCAPDECPLGSELTTAQSSDPRNTSFDPKRTSYAATVPRGTQIVTVEGIAKEGFELSSISPPDADPNTPGHQVRLTKPISVPPSDRADKPGTSAAVGERFLEVVGADWSGAVIVASAENFPDGLAAASLAGSLRAPILLTPKDRLDPAIAKFVRDNNVSEVVIMGGRAAVADTVERSLQDIAGTSAVSRIWGADRYQTAARIAERVAAQAGQTAHLCGTNQRAVFIATGRNSADALAASPAAYAAKTPVLLVDPRASSLHPDVRAFIRDHRIDTAVILGGTKAVPQRLQERLAALAGVNQVTRVAGADRYATAAELAHNITSDCYDDVETVTLANGKGFADALAAGPLTAELNGVLLLTGPNDVPPATLDAMTQLGREAQLTNITLALLAIGDIAQDDNAVTQANNTAGQYLRNPRPFGPATIAAGYGHTCAVRTDSTVQCWGENGEYWVQPELWQGNYTAIATGAGGAHSCGLRKNRTVHCVGTRADERNAPPAGNFIHIAAGSRHSCGIRADGEFTCWGANNWGQLDLPPGNYTIIAGSTRASCGIDDNGTVKCSERVTPPSGQFATIDGGGQHYCGIRIDRTIQCWGHGSYNSHGQSSPPTGRFGAIAAGGHHSCGINTDHTIQCWGSNLEGQSNAPAGQFAAIAAGRTHTCAVKTDGGIVCWGENQFGQSNPPSGRFETEVPRQPQVDTPPLTNDTETISVPARGEQIQAASVEVQFDVTDPTKPTSTTTYLLTIQHN